MRLMLPLSLMFLVCLLQGCFPVLPEGAGAEARRARELSALEAYREDQKIEAVAVDRIYEQFRILIHVNVTSFNRNVLISGEVPDESVKSAIDKTVSGIEGVRHVNNELVISANSSLASRSSDNMITSSIKLWLARDRRTDNDSVKVVTENGTVFLMGNVSRAEADAAAEIASTTNHVKLVVKLFEYTD